MTYQKKYNAIWHKVSADIKKELDSEPAYSKNFLKFLKTKVKSYVDEVADFYDQEIPKLDSNQKLISTSIFKRV